MTETAPYAIGQEVEFKGYSQENPDGKFTPGERLKITEERTEGFIVKSIKSGFEEHLFENDEFVHAKPSKAPSRAKAPAADKEPAAEKAAKPSKAAAKAPAADKAATVKGGSKAADKAADKAKAKAAEDKARQKAEEQAKKAAEKEERTRLAAEEKAKREADKAERNKPVQVVDTEKLTALLAENNNDGLTTARSLLDQVDETYFSLGGVLAHINFNGEYKKEAGCEGSDGFRVYCDTVLGIGYRRAMYWVGIYAYFSGMGLTEADLAGMGWAKAKELVNLTEDRDALLEHIDYAQSHSKVEVIEYAKQVKEEAEAADTSEGGTSGTKGTKTKAAKINTAKFTFKFAGEEAETISSAINRSKEIIGGTANENTALLQIVSEWALSVDGSELTEEQAIAAVEARFGIKLDYAGDDAEAEQAAEAA
jgi:hypothetical protein